MGSNQENKWENISLRKLKAQLTCLQEVAVPESLKKNLLESIPCGKENVVFSERISWWPGILGGAAITVLIAILSLTIILDYSSPDYNQMPIVDLNDNHVLIDHNNGISESNGLSAMYAPNFRELN